MRILVVGEILWDVFPDAERLGGAPFNLAAHARRLGHEVYFISAVGDDPRGRAALARMRELDLPARFVRTIAGQATGTVSVRLDSAGQPDFTIHRPAAYDFVSLSDEDFDELVSWDPDWLCHGTLHCMHPQARTLTRRLVEALPRARRFYDVNLRKHSYTPELLRELMAKATAVKLNDAEATEIERFFDGRRRGLADFAERFAARFGWELVAVTRGAEGCGLWRKGEWVEARGYRVQVVDAVGAGDAFAAALLHGLDAGWPLARVADFANRVGALIASRAGAVPDWTPEECAALG
ncbi:MAG: carbohydrate kinase [Bryobacterales bacterium]|nr:carbohydrate kinase [Bryobacteraceae bacterium]MDW8130186.1 carbohydrate kinase [Bryobacterales bacterium]